MYEVPERQNKRVESVCIYSIDIVYPHDAILVVGTTGTGRFKN